jgi:hypothetical protein
MQLMTSAINSAKEILGEKGKLSEKDVRSIVQMCIDLGGGKLTENASYSILYIRYNFRRYMVNKAADLLCGFEKAAYADGSSCRDWTLQFSLADISGRDAVRFLKWDGQFYGKWYNTVYLSSGGSSLSIHKYRVFGPDGSIIDLSRSFADFEFYDTHGNWVGWSNIQNNLSPSDRGKWGVDCSRLVIFWDNETYSQFSFELSGGSLLLITLRGENQLACPPIIGPHVKLDF